MRRVAEERQPALGEPAKWVQFLLDGQPVALEVAVRHSLTDVLRDQLGVTAVHVGCEEGVCGACTVLVDGQAVRSCLMLAVQADGCRVTTAWSQEEKWAGLLNTLRESWHRHRALQCGYCTPGFLVQAAALLAENPDPDRKAVMAGLAGNLCRCTGYGGIVEAVLEAAGGQEATGS